MKKSFLSVVLILLVSFLICFCLADTQTATVKFKFFDTKSGSDVSDVVVVLDKIRNSVFSRYNVESGFEDSPYSNDSMMRIYTGDRTVDYYGLSDGVYRLCVVRMPAIYEDVEPIDFKVLDGVVTLVNSNLVDIEDVNGEYIVNMTLLSSVADFMENTNSTYRLLGSIGISALSLFILVVCFIVFKKLSPLKAQNNGEDVNKDDGVDAVENNVDSSDSSDSSDTVDGNVDGDGSNDIFSD